MKYLIALAATMGCGGDSVHDAVTCGAWPSMPELAGKQCERGCELQPPNWEASGEDMPCMASHPDGSGSCERTFEVDGLRGCCLQPPLPNSPIRYEFFVCD